jgi:hypothetical protein
MKETGNTVRTFHPSKLCQDCGKRIGKTKWTEQDKTNRLKKMRAKRFKQKER